VRATDVLLLAQHFITHFARMFERDVRGLSPEAADRLLRHSWPGNVRELRNAIEHGVSLIGGGKELTPELLGLRAGKRTNREPAKSGTASFHETKEKLIDDWEREYLTELVRATGGNVARAARRAGLARQYLHRLMRKHRIALED
jgi:DNA-binding NtrC family response regulator